MERRTNQPLPMLHPTTPHALPLARISSGKISAGYSHGTVNHVAPKMAVKRKTKKVAAIPAPIQVLESALLSTRGSYRNMTLAIGTPLQLSPAQKGSECSRRRRTCLGRRTRSGILADARKAADEKSADSHADGTPV